MHCQAGAQSFGSAKAELSVKTRQELAPGIVNVDGLFAAEYKKEHAAGLTVGIVSGRELVWTKSYGLADVSKGRPATTDTVYRIGSITKQFTALMLLQLVQEGKVHFSDPVEKFFPEVNQINGRYPGAPPITLIQLATHHSGLSEEPDDVERFTTGPVSQWEQILVAALPRLKYVDEPGTHFVLLEHRIRHPRCCIEPSCQSILHRLYPRSCFQTARNATHPI